MGDKIDQQLAQTLDKLFQRQSLERNIYIFNQLKPNLEIPISLVARERKVMNITTDEKLVLSALRKCDRVALNEDKKTLLIKLQPAKSRLVVKAPFDDKRVREAIEALIQDNFGHSEYKVEVDKHNNLLVNLPSEVEAEQLLALLAGQSELKLNCVLEERDPYQELKDSIDRIKKQKKDKNQMFNPFDNPNNYPQQQQQQWVPQANLQNMQAYGYNNYAAYGALAKPERVRGPGYTRRAVESSDEEEPAEKRPKYREKEEPQKPLPVAEIEKRTRLNSENFPSLEDEAKVEAKVLKHIYQKKEIVEVFTNLVLSHSIKINQQLAKSGIPLLKPDGNFRLEAMKLGGRKQSTFDSPKITPIIAGHKQSH